VPKGHNPNRKRKKFEELEKKNGIKNTHTWKIMSEEPGKVTPQDSHKWMGNTFGVKGVKCTTQNERKCEAKGKWEENLKEVKTFTDQRAAQQQQPRNV